MKHFQTHTHKFAEDAAVYNDQFPHPWRLTDTKEAKKQAQESKEMGKNAYRSNKKSGKQKPRI